MKTRSKMAVSIAVLMAAAIVSSAHGQAASSVPGALGSTWADVTKMPDLFTGQWMTRSSMIEGDPKLNVPFTDTAQKYVDEYKFQRDIPYAQEGCRTPGLFIAMRSGPLKFSYSPGLITIYMQGVGDPRFIRMNEPMGHTTPKYYGNSVGHWEGDTLVIETQDFVNEISFQYGVGEGLPMERLVGDGQSNRPPPPPGLELNISKAIWGPHGPNLRSVERIRMVDPNTLETKLTVYDDTVWKTPFQGETRQYRRIVKGVSESRAFSGQPEEWICTVSITSFDPETNQYVDKDPEEMVKFLDGFGK